MSDEGLTLAPTADPNVFQAPDGRRLRPPDGWACLPPGDAGLTRRVKAAGPWWAVIEKRGRKAFSRGLWAPRLNIEAARAALDQERATEGYAKKRAADVQRRERAQAQYVVTFEEAVRAFLRFAPRWETLGQAMAQKIAVHATPVGSGTVARTERIPVQQRAEAATIAWMRHQTTAYDHLHIPRVAGARREVRRELAEISRAVLDLHRRDTPHAPHGCPLCKLPELTAAPGAGLASATTARPPRAQATRADGPIGHDDHDGPRDSRSSEDAALDDLWI
ncbi:MAG: DUF2293 domain-containing protein [Myxococcales bacterium]|nr:DUF2293 domain-containing protein [Myxococcales bacterium]